MLDEPLLNELGRQGNGLLSLQFITRHGTQPQRATREEETSLATDEDAAAEARIEGEEGIQERQRLAVEDIKQRQRSRPRTSGRRSAEVPGCRCAVPSGSRSLRGGALARWRHGKVAVHG